MKKFLSMFIGTLLLTQPIQSNNLNIKKVVIWGYKLYSHTHSYVHYGFHRAFKHLGYETYWLDGNDDVSQMDFSGTLFITECNCDTNIPLRDDCWYVLHNCHPEKYEPLYKKGRCIALQVYTHDCLSKNVEKIDEYQYYSIPNRIIYLPWATDLLPHEIDAIKATLPTHRQPSNVIYYIGTIWDGIHGNINQLSPFQAACRQNHITFQQMVHRSMEDNIALVQSSYFAPAIQGEWQCNKGYIPCRIFKNISYGHIGVTNSETVYNLFNKKIVYNPDTYQLFYDAQEKLKNFDINEQYELMDFVKEKHTYLNRIEQILKFIELAYQDYTIRNNSVLDTPVQLE